MELWEVSPHGQMKLGKGKKKSFQGLGSNSRPVMVLEPTEEGVCIRVIQQKFGLESAKMS